MTSNGPLDRTRRGTAPRVRLPARSTGPRPAVGSVDPRGRLGATVEVLKQAVYERARHMRGLLESDDTVELDRILAGLAQEELSVAVVGQVKAGKSTFINAVVERPGLLPSDVNPWTAAIAKLHFGRPKGPQDGARFDFFTEEEWRHMAELGGRAGELARGLAPDGEPEALQEQMADMKIRAEQRLGKQFKHLLGKRHRFQTIERPVLERYLCSGEEPEGLEEATETAGRFADITREANLYFEQAPFGTYCAVIDTPGTNDPFLVRGEITRRYLGRAHAYVLVLAAQQALNSSDLALLQMLHGLHKARLVIFVNRADKLDDPVRDGDLIRAHVSKILAREFPGHEIPVILGSAWCAERALAEDDAWLAEMAGNRGLGKLGCHLKAFTAEQWAAWAADPAAHRDELRQALLACSGVDEVRSCLSHLLIRGRGAHVLGDAVGGLLHVAGAATARSRREASEMDTAIRTLRVGSAAAERELARLRGGMASLASRRGRFVEAWNLRTEALDALLGQAQENLSRSLSATVRRFAEAQAKQLLETGTRRGGGRLWRCDTGPLRQALELRFITDYEALRAQVASAQNDLRGVLRELVEGGREDGPTALDWARPAAIDPAPSMSTIGRAVAVDLGSAWQRWLRSEQTTAVKASELRDAIVADFGPVVQSLVASALGALRAAVATTIDRFRRALKQHADADASRHEELRQLYEARVASTRPEDVQASLAALEERMARCRDRVMGLRRAAAELAALPVVAERGSASVS